MKLLRAVAHDPLRSILIAASAIILVLYIMFQQYAPGLHVPPPGHDSLLVYQYARAMNEGHPYQYNEGDAPTTGSTSHIYPAIVALFYLLGAKGDALPTAGFIFHSLLFLILLGGVWFISRRIYPESSTLTTLLVLLSGHVIFTVFNQNDMGLFAVTAIWGTAAMLTRRWAIVALLLVISSFNRPEGMVMSGLLVLVSVLPLGSRRSVDWQMAAAGVIGVLAFGAVMLLNKYLTGHYRFTSVIGKGVFGLADPALVISEIADKLSGDILGILFGLDRSDRKFILLPVFGGLAALVGLASRPWTDGPFARIEFWLVLNLMAVIAMLSTSGLSGQQFDRHVIWILPIWFMYAAIGCHQIGQKLALPHVFQTLAGVMLSYHVLGFVYLGSALLLVCSFRVPEREFVRRAAALMPEGSRVGTGGRSGIKYYLPRHSVSTVYGIDSADFVFEGGFSLVNAEQFRHEPDRRFDFWLPTIPELEQHWFSTFLGPPLLVQPPVFSEAEAFSLNRADWSTVDGVTEPLDPTVLGLIRGRNLVDQIDVGYSPQEAASGYSVEDRVSGSVLPPMIETLQLASRRVTDVGRVVIGSDAMRVRANPGREMVLVLRTCTLAGVKKVAGIQRFAFHSPLVLKIYVDDREAGVLSMLLNGPTDFTEGALLIPGEMIGRREVEVRIEGDHAAFAYWFYQ